MIPEELCLGLAANLRLLHPLPIKGVRLLNRQDVHELQLHRNVVRSLGAGVRRLEAKGSVKACDVCHAVRLLEQVAGAVTRLVRGDLTCGGMAEDRNMLRLELLSRPVTEHGVKLLEPIYGPPQDGEGSGGLLAKFCLQCCVTHLGWIGECRGEESVHLAPR